MMEETRHNSNATRMKKKFSVTLNISSLENLRQLSQSLPSEDKKAFAKKYGAILDLLFIPVDTSALNVLAQYWSPALRCFELPNIDVTPTIEEYACMLRLPMRKDSAVYFRLEEYLSETKIAEQFGELLEVPMAQIRLTGHTDSRGLTRAFVEARLKELMHLREWGTFARVLALAIYGLVLFPSAPDMVDQAAMDVFFAVEKKKRNPVPAVLAETFLTLNFCQRKTKGKLRCCVHLLYVWIITHMHAGNHIKSVAEPLRSFHRIPAKSQDEYEWREEFNNMDARSFKWVCPWYGRERGDIIYSCGDFPNVPLMGPRGCVAYTPAIVLKQLCWTQRKPQEERLGGLCFWYKDGKHTQPLARDIKEAWRDIRMAGRIELGKPLVIDTSEYVAWRKTRKASQTISKEASGKEDNSQPILQMAEQLEVMKAQMQVLEQQKQTAELEAVIAQNQCEKKARLVERLKDELADVSSKERENVMATMEKKVQSLEGDIRRLERARNELTEEIKRQEIINEELAMEVNWQRQEKEELIIEAHKQKQEKKELAYRVEELTALLAQTKGDRDHARAVSMQYRDSLIQAASIGKFWRTQALEQEAQIGDLKEKHAKIIGELNHYIPNFIYLFEKAEEEIHVNPMLHLPREVEDFMKMSRSLARGLKRRRTKLLM